MSQEPKAEARGGQKIAWSHVQPGEPLPEVPEPVPGQTYDATEALDAGATIISEGSGAGGGSE